MTRAFVEIEGETIGAIGLGWAVLLGVGQGDDEAAAVRLAARVAHLRAFADKAGRMNRSLLEVGGAALVVPQFTLYADTRRGRRPSFVGAAPPERAAPLVECFVAALGALGAAVEVGRFGAHMVVDITNDGPVTFLLEELPTRRRPLR